MTDDYTYLKKFLERCQAVTDEFEKHLLPSDLKNKVLLQMLKMFEEVAEVQRAILDGDPEHTKRECYDSILAAIAMLNKLGETPDQIMVGLELELQKVEGRAERDFGKK